MWMTTKHGSYSIVQRRPGVYQVRGGGRGDMEALTAPGGPLEGEEIQDGQPRWLWPAQVTVGKESVRRVLAWMLDELDVYPARVCPERLWGAQITPWAHVAEELRA